MPRPPDNPDPPAADEAEKKSATGESSRRYEGHEGENDTTMSYGHQRKPGGSSATESLSSSSFAAGKGSISTQRYAGIQRKATGAPITDGAEKQLERARQSSGAALPADLSGHLSNALGTDLSSVRVHNDTSSHEGAKSIGAKAYTEGQDVHFGAGRYEPSSRDGQRLIAHEVAHTVQQQGSSPSIENKQEISSPGDTHEQAADGFADAFVAGGNADGYSFVSLSRPAVSIGSVSGKIHRDKDSDADFDGLDYGEQERLFRAASVPWQVVYFSRVSRPQRRYTLFTSLEPSQQTRLISAILREDRSAIVNKLPVGDTAGWFRNRQLDTYQQYLVYLSITDTMRMELISELAGRVGGLFKALSVRERSQMIGLIPVAFIRNFFESYPGDIADLYDSVPSDMKAYVFARMPLDMQNAVAIGTATDESKSKSTSKSKPDKTAEKTEEPAKAPSSTDESLSATLAKGNAALGAAQGLTAMYSAAVDSLQVNVLLDLGRAIAGQVESARAEHTRMSAQAHGDDGHTGAVEAFGERLTGAEATVANAVGPNKFRGRSIAGRSQHRLPAIDVAAYITEQTAAVMELLETVIEIKQLLGDEPDEASDAVRQRAVSKIELWRSNFLHFQFLRKVLTDEGYFATLRDAKGESGTKLKDTAEEVVEDWRRRGEPKKQGDPWYVQIGRAVEAGVKYVIPDFEDLPEITLRTNLALIMWDVSGAIVEGVGDATGLYHFEQDGQSTLGETAEPIARHPTRMYDGVVEALAE